MSAGTRRVLEALDTANNALFGVEIDEWALDPAAHLEAAVLATSISTELTKGVLAFQRRSEVPA